MSLFGTLWYKESYSFCVLRLRKSVTHEEILFDLIWNHTLGYSKRGTFFFVSPEKDNTMNTYESQVDVHFLPWNIHKCLMNEPIFFLKLFCLLKFTIIKNINIDMYITLSLLSIQPHGSRIKCPEISESWKDAYNYCIKIHKLFGY